VENQNHDKHISNARFARRISKTNSATNIFPRLALLAAFTKPTAQQTNSLGSFCLLLGQWGSRLGWGGQKIFFPTFPQKKISSKKKGLQLHWCTNDASNSTGSTKK
jgi:hypothetical protein